MRSERQKMNREILRSAQDDSTFYYIRVLFRSPHSAIRNLEGLS